MPSYRLSQLVKTAKDYAPLVFQIGSIFFLLFSAYLTSRIAPLADNIKTAITRVDALESVVESKTPSIDKLLVTEEKINNLEGGIIEIKQSQIRMENKIDNFILRESR